jgi:hypothetical protein
VAFSNLQKSLVRGKEQWVLWQGLQAVIDASPEIPPCTNFPDLFFGDASPGHSFADSVAAKKLCGTCPIQLPCAQYAIAGDEQFGVWGGLSFIDRKRLRRKHGSASKAVEALEVRYRRYDRDGIQADKR